MLLNLKIILISGTPGTGKTSLVEYLTKIEKWYSFNLGEFVLKNNLYIKEDIERNTKIIDTKLVAIKGVIELYKIFNSSKNNNLNQCIILVDSHYSDIIIEGLKYLEDNEIKLNSEELSEILVNFIHNIKIKSNFLGIILRCEPFELQNRLLKKGYNQNKIKENIESEILGQCTYSMVEVLDRDNVFEIDTSKKKIDEVANIIKEIIKGNSEILEKYRIGNINWLREIGKSSKYDRFIL